MFRNILVAVDGSKSADRALAEAIDLAAAAFGKLTILTAVPKATVSASMAGIVPASLSRELKTEYDDILRRARGRVPHEVPLTTVLTLQPVREALRNLLRTGNYDLLVIGSRGRRPLRAAVFGNVGRHILYHSQFPVLTIHDVPDPRQPRPERAQEVVRATNQRT